MQSHCTRELSEEAIEHQLNAERELYSVKNGVLQRFIAYYACHPFDCEQLLNEECDVEKIKHK